MISFKNMNSIIYGHHNYLDFLMLKCVQLCKVFVDLVYTIIDRIDDLTLLARKNT